MALVVSWVGFLVCLVLVCTLCIDATILPSTSIAKIRLNSWKRCPEYPHLTSSFDDLIFFPGPENPDLMYVDGKLTIGTEIPVDTILRVDYRKCYTSEGASCEKYLVTDLRDVCKKLVDDTQTWYQFIKQIDGFNPKCPLKPGTYAIEEAPVDMSPFENMTEFAGHWQLEVSFVSKREVLGCVLADVEVYLQNKYKKS